MRSQTPKENMVSDENERKYPYRIVDRLNRGWLTRGDGKYECFDPTRQRRDDYFIRDKPMEEIEADAGPIRTVVSAPAEDRTELVSAFEACGRKLITSLTSALEQVFHEARGRARRDGDELGAGAWEYAKRTLVAGRPGSWEAESLLGVVMFGNELNLHPHKERLTVEHMRSTGPNRKRVDVEQRDRMADVLRRWTDGEHTYVEVPETLAGLVSDFADSNYDAEFEAYAEMLRNSGDEEWVRSLDEYRKTYEPKGWKNIADQWLQPKSLARENFFRCYHLLYSTSTHFDASLLD